MSPEKAALVIDATPCDAGPIGLTLDDDDEDEAPVVGDVEEQGAVATAMTTPSYRLTRARQAAACHYPLHISAGDQRKTPTKAPGCAAVDDFHPRTM